MDSFSIAPGKYKSGHSVCDPIAFGRRMKALCLAHFGNEVITCAELGYINQHVLRRHWSGQGLPASKVYYALAVYGFNLNWLFTGQGSMYDSTPAGIALAQSGAVVSLADNDTGAQ